MQIVTTSRILATLPSSDPPGHAPESCAGSHFLHDITLAINRGASFEETFALIYERLRAFVPYNRIAVALADEGREHLQILAARSDGPLVLGCGYSGEIAGSSLEPLFREGKIRVIGDLEEYLRNKPSSESTRLIVKEGMKSSLTLPLMTEGNPVGVIFFTSRLAHAYRPEHEEFLGTIAGHMAIAVERSRLIDTLREKSEFLENVLHHSGDAIIVLDPAERIRTWSEGARKIFGFAREGAVGENLDTLLRPKELEAAPTAKGNGRPRNLEWECVAKDGRTVVVQVSSAFLSGKNGRPLGRSLIARDVTDLKRLQEELVRIQSLEIVGDLAATVAHEIRNPLAGMSGVVQVLVDSFSSSDERRPVAGELLGQIRRLDSTVRDLLTFARPATPSRQDLSLKDSLAAAWSLIAPEPRTSKVRFSLEAAAGLRIVGDRHLLQEVWVNLFQNAIEAMPGGGDLRVSAHDGNPVHVEVRDSGGGLDPSIKEKLFRPFFTTKTQGSGLGLSIARKIIEAHGGRIWCESEPGKTTSFIVEVPE